jgi:hypothetical protein
VEIRAAMTTNELVSFLNQLPFVIIAIVTLYNAIRRPRRAAIDIALLFGALAAIVVIGWTVEQIELLDHPASTTIQVILLIALPYLLLRIVSDFMAVRSWIVGSAAVLFVALASAIVWFNEPLPDLLTIITATYFIVLVGYASWKFVRGARVASGVTARRLYAASTGSALLSLVVAVIAAQAVSERFNTFGVDAALQTLVVTTGLSYFVAFSPPSFLRRAWQEPELRALLARVAVLPRLPERTMIVRELEAGAAATLGARGASIGLWDLDRQTLVYPTINGGGESSENIGITGQVFASERPHFSENAPRDDPGQADIYRRLNAIAILAAPITAGTRRLGVLAVYAERPPIFADDDLRLVELLADQAAVILESHLRPRGCRRAPRRPACAMTSSSPPPTIFARR